jgi:magnesium-protoporphyrin IX monomethyl ester (oxidative) cyclase
MITSRGCPYTCSFCDRTVFEHQYQFNSPAYIHAHMKHLRDRFGVRHINFYDDLFTAHMGRVSELCQRLIDEPLNMGFNCIIRTGHTSDELLRLLKRAGCVMVSLGVESADPGLMARHKAGVTLEAVRDTVEKVHAAGLRAKGLFIFGLPGETPETFQRTSDFILSLDLDDMNLTKFSPLHGAPLWAECAAGTGGEFNEDWRLLNCVNSVFLPEGFESREQMDALYNGHIQRFYKSKAYQRRFGRRLWEHRWSLWHMLRHLPMVWAAQRYFASKGTGGTLPYDRHPRQPVGLKPMPLGR